MTQDWQPTLGAVRIARNIYKFRVWAPNAQHVDLDIQSPNPRLIPMERDDNGYHSTTVQDVSDGTLYCYRLDGREPRPDPSSRSQSQGVHGPSQIAEADFTWDDQHWSGYAQQDYIIYELHVGTFTAEGTFEAIIPYLDELRDLGITAIELLPIAQFPGERNWGYDGVDLFAPQNSYGGSVGLKRLVNACHQRQLCLILDTVYNHFGPEGNYWSEFGPYFTERYHTPWGVAINFDGPQSDDVRQFFIENALYWFNEFHVDALRLDATDFYMDFSAYTFFEALVETVHQNAIGTIDGSLSWPENDRNDVRLTRPAALGGYGVDAQWVDDFHHALHTVLTNEQMAYYADFGEMRQLAKSIREGFIYSGEYSAYRQRRRGTSSRDIPAWHFVVYGQNHDQVGNRMLGERFSHMLSFDGLKLAAAVVLLSPYLPLLFMGEEYAETAPFLYFVDHSDPELAELVRQGRRKEFEAFQVEGDPFDPTEESTFQKSKLNHALKNEGKHRELYALYRELIRLRKSLPALSNLNKEQQEVICYEKLHWITIRRWQHGHEVVIAYSFSHEAHTICVPVPSGQWRTQLASSVDQMPSSWTSDGELTLTLAPLAFVLLEKI